MPSVFDAADVAAMIDRINRLTPSTAPLWGKMSVDQMLTHCCVSYDMVYTDRYPPVGALKRWLITMFVKNAVVGPKPYPKNTPTAPEFRIADHHDFAQERARLVAYLQRVQQEGAAAYEGRPSRSFGPLTSAEWNTLYYKHLDHHLAQFGV